MAFVIYPDIPGLQIFVCVSVVIRQVLYQGLHHAEGVRLQVSPRSRHRPGEADRDREGPRGQDRAASGGPILQKKW